MTALDDALNSSSVQWGKHLLWAYWRELDNGDIGTNADSPSDLSAQIGGAIEVSHQLDDGLPDTVTMTSGGNASGTMTAILNGKPGLTLASSGQRAYTTSGVFTSSTTTNTYTENFNSTTFVSTPGWFVTFGMATSGDWWSVVQQQSGTISPAIGASDTGSEIQFPITSTPVNAQLEFAMDTGNHWAALNSAGLGNTLVTITARVKFDQPTSTLPDNCRVGLIFEDSSNNEILQVMGDTADSHGQYITITASATAPPSAVAVRADFRVDFLDTTPQNTTFHIDSMSIATTQTADAMTGAIPSTAQRGDYLVAAVLIDNPSAAVIQTASDDPKNNWRYLGQVATGASGLGLWLYAMPNYYPGQQGIRLQADRNFNYVIVTTAFWAFNPNGIPLGYRVRAVDTKSETVSGTSHSLSSTLYGRGYQLNFWASYSNAWTAGSGTTEWGEIAGPNGLDLMLSTSALRESGVYTNTATTATTTAVALMATVALEPYVRPSLDGRQYFSPFNKDSPIYGFDRDTADVKFQHSTLTASGSVTTPLFSGTMADLAIQGRQAQLQAASSTRINMNNSVTLPVVFGYREGCTTDWLLSWLLSRGGRYVGPAPTVYTRAWAPLHGSTHAHIEGPYTYNYILGMFSSNPGVWYGLKNPYSVAGPFLTAMYGQQSATQTTEVKLVFSRPDLNVNSLQAFQPDVDGNTSPVQGEMFSQKGSTGRITFWLRGDPVQAAPSYMTTLSDNDFIFNFYLYVTDTTGAYLGYVRFGVRSADRKVEVIMGSAASGGPQGFFYNSPGTLSTDGSWDFYGFQWDFAKGEVYIQRNNSAEVYSTSWMANGWNNIWQLPPTDEQGRALGYKTSMVVRSHVPLAEFMYEAGVPAHVNGQWANWYPTPVAPGKTVITRPTYQPIAAIANPTPVAVWDTIADLAQATVSMYRANEDDNFEFLPPSYFGETAQMTPQSVVVDVASNAQDPDVTLDPSKSRNVVTVQFKDTSVSTNPISVLKYSQSLAIPRGITYVTFTLDIPTVEIHGQSDPSNAWWTLTNLSSSQIANPSTIPTGVHYATFNTAADGSGAQPVWWQVHAYIQYGDASTITIKFQNLSGATVYMANNGQDVPFMNILGYGVTANDGYSTARDDNSALVRGERGLSTELDWVQDRKTAESQAALLATIVSRPRAELDITVMGDPRRRPGQLVTLKDTQGTAAAGTWRILSVDHNINGAQYTQNLSLVYVGPVLNWDDPNTTWDNAVWGA